nr:NADH dehydrogenase subunit 2 [Paradorydium reflexanum]
MLNNLTKMSLMNIMVIGVIMVICSNNFMSMWMGLEISLLSFIPMMSFSKSTGVSESMIKYFIIQCISSSMFLFSVISMLIGVNMEINESIILISMALKMGLMPFHNWILFIIEMIDWTSILIMLTVLKIPPFYIVNQLTTEIMMIFVFTSIWLSPIMCINQSSIKKLIVFSSVYNLGIMVSTINKFNLTLNLLLIYSIMLFLLTKTLSSLKINYINQIVFNDFSKWTKINLWINMLSMAGFPATMGFMMKIMVLEKLITENQFFISMTMIISSIIVIVFYTRMAFNCMMTTQVFKKWNKLNNYWNLTLLSSMTVNFTTSIFLISAKQIL